MTIPTFTLKGSALDLLDVTNPVALDSITFTPNTRGQVITVGGTVYRPEPVTVDRDASGKINGNNGVVLLANDESLNLLIPLQYKVSISAAAGFPRQPKDFWIEAPAAGQTVYLGDLSAVPVTSATGFTRGPRGVDDVRRAGDSIEFIANGERVGDLISLLVSSCDGGSPDGTGFGSIDGGTL